MLRQTTDDVPKSEYDLATTESMFILELCTELGVPRHQLLTMPSSEYTMWRARSVVQAAQSKIRDAQLRRKRDRGG